MRLNWLRALRGRRGEWYVAGQGALFLLLVGGPRSSGGLPPWPSGLQAAGEAGGAVLLATGALIALLAATHLGRSLTPLPHPRDDGSLVLRGLYRWVRHPIYFGVILMAFGWALYVQGTLTLVYAGLLFLFLDLKSRREERWLLARYPHYAAYRRRVRKLLPFLY